MFNVLCAVVCCVLFIGCCLCLFVGCCVRVGCCLECVVRVRLSAAVASFVVYCLLLAVRVVC